MATTKPISTISYNTVPFLKEKLDNWVKAHWIQAYMFIHHKGEDGDKDHIHLRIEPNKSLDPMNLTEELKEYEPGNNKPLTVRPWRSSKEEDWILYIVHDPEYLKIHYGDDPKGEKIPYEWNDIVGSDGYDVETAYIRAKATLRHSASNLTKRLKAGEQVENMLMQGENVFTINAIQKAISYNEVKRLREQAETYKRWFAGLKAYIEYEGYNVLYDEHYKNFYIEKEVEEGAPRHSNTTAEDPKDNDLEPF